MKAAIMQPTYLPWMGYFALMMEVDIFIFLDDVQFSKGSWQQKNRIKASHGERPLNIPVDIKGSASRLIKDILLKNGQEALAKHLSLIENDYRKAPFLEEVRSILNPIYTRSHTTLSSLNVELITNIAKYLKVENKVFCSSSFELKSIRTQRLIELLERVGANEYLSPIGSFNYIDEDNLFEKEGIRLTYQNFEPPGYCQLYPPFTSHLSTIDLLFNEGKDSSEIIKSGIKQPLSHLELVKRTEA